MINITENGVDYRAELNEKDKGYTVLVFIKGDKMPLAGTRFGLKASFKNEIMPWIEEVCKRQSTQELVNQKLFEGI